MESMQPKKFWPWIIGGLSLLIVLACVLTVVFGAAGIRIVNQMAKGNQTERKGLSADTTPETAVLQDLQGWVEVESETGEWASAVSGQSVAAGRHLRTGNLSSVTLVFNDGSQALLKAASEISIDELNAQPDGKPRTIVMTQISGESSHAVIPNTHSESRYEVHTPAGAGIAKGTEFQVVVTPQQTAYYYVIKGIVAVRAMETTVLVNPGYMTILYINQPPIAPVQTISVEGLVSHAGGSWTVAGTTFTPDDITVIVGSPQVGDWVMVKGHLDENNQTIADWITLLHPAVTNQFSLTGTVEGMETGKWKIDGQTILVTETTELDENIQMGDTVYVKGLIESGGELQAVLIERIDEEAGSPFEFTGIVQKIEEGLWDISGVSILTNETTTLAEGIKAGDLVMVKGRIQGDGSWLAEKITLASEGANEFTFTGKLESKDPWKAAGISFQTTHDTVIQSDLTPGDLVRVEGVIDDNGVWSAIKIERMDFEALSKFVLIGTVMTINPWVVNGIPLTIAPEAVIDAKITVGMLVRVELILQSNGTWQVIKIEPISNLVWFPGCMDVIATIVSVNGNQLQLLNWPVVTIEGDATIEGTLAPNSVIRMRVCFDQALIIKVTYIIIIQPGTVDPPVGDEGGKVIVCHKPGGKKGGHTLSIGRAALPAHLGHGDTEGACR
jgi:hypothetical protein